MVDMRSKGAGAKQVVVEDGRAVPLDGRQTGYQFPYEGDADLFEGAKVRAVADGTPSDGRIASVFERKIVVSLDADFGPRIGVCILRIDNTAMLDALRDRLEKIAQGEVSSFNRSIADGVLRNEGGEPPITVALAPGDILLKGGQERAAHVALENRISYIWGPPGTGKTRALSAICKSLFDGQKRVLICSNTNQAVDQVLYKLCSLLSVSHEAVQEGRILRIGRIALEELRSEWSDYVTIDGVVDRLSLELRQRRAELEENVERVRRICEGAARIVAGFEQLERGEARLASLEAADAASRRDSAKLTIVANKLAAQVAELTKESESIATASALARFFKRSQAAVQAGLQKAHHALNDVKTKLNELAAVQQGATSEIVAARNSVASWRASLRSHDRRKLEKEIAEADTKVAPLAAELAQLAKQLDDIAKTVVEKAMIIGATATKLFLSPQTFAGFDAVVIDEASMLMLPALFHAAGLAKERVVISGDFRQLPPIVTTDQKAVLETVGGDVFSASGIAKAFAAGKTPERAAFLDQQFRMADPICALISGPMYRGRLHTAATRKSAAIVPIAPFNLNLTIVDTSTISPFVNRDPFKSRYNLMHALAIRNLVLRLQDTGFVRASDSLGVCTPYSAQAKMLQRVLKGSKLNSHVETGTVHRFQGDEKQAMVLDIPDGLGEQSVGMWLEADNPDDDGAKLFNVAISRAKEHLIVVANLQYLDSKLPARALLRGVLHDMQRKGTVLDVRDVLGYYPMLDDIATYGLALNLDSETLRTGLFNQKDFEHVWIADAERAKKSIVIFSGFVTPQRVATCGDILRKKLEEGVSIRCVTRPPRQNGSIPPEDGKAALDALETVGCIVDTRWDIHEKTIIIDGEILWFGSLNPLSHSGATSEIMARFVSTDIASQVAAFLAVERGLKEGEAADQIVRKENPDCPDCGGRTTFRKGQYGPFWECEEGCGWRQNIAQAKRKSMQTPPLHAPSPCPKCGKPMVARSSSFGSFFGCSDYPRCDATVNPHAKPRTGTRRKKPAHGPKSDARRS
jgi:ssDNA-binding Zn-finger/Zn-ribbon topoisomerase 1